MRTPPDAAAAALSVPKPAFCLLVRMDLTAPVFVTSAGGSIDWDGHTWLGVSVLGAVDEITDTISDRAPLRFTLSGIPNDVLGLALESANEARGKRCRVYLGLYDLEAGDGLAPELVWVDLVWSGTLDQMTISEGESQGEISVTAEHRGVTFARAKVLRYTDADQRRLYPGDKALQFIVSQSTHQDVWPSAEWFKQ